MRLHRLTCWTVALAASCTTPPEQDPIFSASPAAAQTASNVAHAEEAYAWGDHSKAGYLKSEADPLFTASVASGITASDITRWNLTADAGHLVAEVDPLFQASPAAAITASNVSAWSSAYSWGNHAAAGYLTAEADPIFAAAPASTVSAAQIANWNTAHAWGDHAAAGYLRGITAADATLSIAGAATTPTVAVNTAAVQARVTGSCALGQAITAINADGTVSCGGSAAPARVIRWAQWSSYDQNCCWFASSSDGNGDPNLFGGVRPQSWGDSNGVAWQMSPSAEVMRTLFNKKLYPGSNAMIAADTWLSYSSTNSRHTAVLMRVKSVNAAATPWTLSFHATCFTGWGERASVTINGSSTWQCSTDTYSNALINVALSVPPNATSTVIVISASTAPSGASRTNLLAFTNNSLSLPAGLSFVDDLDEVMGNLW